MLFIGGYVVAIYVIFLGGFSLGVKRSWHKADHSLPTTAEVKE
jgi:hypothetical protein